MLKLTKSLPVIKERNCSAYLALNTRTNRKNASEFVYALFTQNAIKKSLYVDIAKWFLLFALKRI